MSNTISASALKRNKLVLAATLALPIVGIAGVWASTHYEAQQGVDWYIPIQGYDPRDLLRGHYVQFNYEWPGLSAEDVDKLRAPETILCLKGNAPEIREVEMTSDLDDEWRTRNCKATVRANIWSEEGERSLVRDRIFLPQEMAAEADKKLRDQSKKALVKVRINRKGYMRPLSLEFRRLQAGETPARDTTMLQIIEIKGPDE